MVYTEIKTRNNKKYFYRVLSVRDKNKVSKKRIYLGSNLLKQELLKKQKQADEQLRPKTELNKLIPKIIKILKQNKIKKAGIFGSYARGEQKKNSDIDILIEPPKNIGFGFVGIQFQLEQGLKRKIDLITYKSINHLLKKTILNEETRII